MKKLFLIVPFVMLIMISSCGGDDEGDTISVNNTITVGNEVFEISNGAFIDFGVTSEVYEISFALSDGTITPNTSSFSFTSSSSLRVLFSLAAAGNSIAEGSYTLGDILNAAEGRVFLQPIVQVNGDPVSVSDGTITLQGSSPNFTLLLDLDLTSGEKLSGGYNGTFVSQ